VLGPEINHEHIVQERADELAEGFVLRVHDVGVEILLALKRENEAVRETLVLLLFADVGASFQGYEMK